MLLMSFCSQTKDEVTHAAVDRLRNRPGGLTVESILGMEQNALAQILKPVGFYNNKAKYLQKCAAIMKAEHESDVPSDLKTLLSLPGIGPKMAYLILNVAWNKQDGICVDVVCARRRMCYSTE